MNKNKRDRASRAFVRLVERVVYWESQYYAHKATAHIWPGYGKLRDMAKRKWDLALAEYHKMEDRYKF